MQSASRLRAREVGRSVPKQSARAAVETGLEAGCADDMPEVYKMSMARMSQRLTKSRRNDSKLTGGRNAVAA